MRIAVSGMFWSEPYVGSGQYLQHLVAALHSAPSEHRYVLVLPRYLNPKKPSLPGWQVVSMPTPFDRYNHNLAKVWFEQIALNQVCSKLRVDLVHIPYFAAPLHTRRPVVVTIHDLIPLLVPTNRGGRAVQQYMRLASAGAKRAAAVIADSEHTKHDIIKHLGIIPSRISTIHLAAAPSFGPRDPANINAVRERFRIQGPYAYYIGGFQAHKNLPMLIDAFAAAIQNMPERPLLVIGGRQPPSDDKIFPDINRAILQAGIAGDTSLLGRVSDEENAALMAGCSVFLCPSRYEGFGLPPLEAMTCGAPVIASSTTSVGEVVADGGLLVDPDDRQGWIDAIRHVLTDADFAQNLRQRAIHRAGQFNWTKTATETRAVYETLAAM